MKGITMKITTLIAVSLLSLTAMAANAGEGYLNVRKAQEKREVAPVAQSDAARKAADDYAGAAIKANQDNYRNH